MFGVISDLWFYAKFMHPVERIHRLMVGPIVTYDNLNTFFAIVERGNLLNLIALLQGKRGASDKIHSKFIIFRVHFPLQNP